MRTSGYCTLPHCFVVLLYATCSICNAFVEGSGWRGTRNDTPLRTPDLRVGYRIRTGDNEPCDQDANCRFSGQICREGFCRCPQGMFFVDSIKGCYKRIYSTDDQCDITEQCQNFATLSVCSSHRCKCPENYKMLTSPYPLCIFQGGGQIQHCYGDENCLIPGQGCIRGYCQCVRGTFFVPGRGECFNKITQNPMDVCKVNEQCEDFAHRSQCISSHCRCPEGYVLQTSPQKACIRGGSGTHDLCIGNMQCGYRNQICSQGFCYPRVTRITDTCEVTDQCEDFAPNSRCRAGFCSCPDNLKMLTVPSPRCVLNGSVSGYSSLPNSLIMAAVLLLVTSHF